MIRAFTACLAATLLATPATAASYGYYLEAGPLTCVQEGIDNPCGSDPVWISHFFDLNEDLVPGGTLVNAHLSFEGWAPHEFDAPEGAVIPIAPEWSSDLWRVDDGIFYIIFDMMTGSQREIVSLHMSSISLGESGFYFHQYVDGTTSGTVISACEVWSECTRWTTVAEAAPTHAPIPAALPMLLAALAGLGLLARRRRS